MAATYATDARLVELYPALAEQSPALREVWLKVAEGMVHEETFDDILDAAHAAMTGHLLTHGTKKGGAKVSSKSLGPASYSYAVAPVSSDLQETKYGRDFLLMLRTRVATVVGVA